MYVCMYVHELTWMCQVISEEEAEQRANDVEEGKRETICKRCEE